ncbi:nucleoside-diphosphate-sugar epimerase [Chthonomonas calidirosea]|uniref:Nucleoside-diphosphate-sugar epimerases n=1 Tax=Chthonomonas calidirosea (strain DSM 23976 / ICMP 18418 / T49) TaxID=1303518 RepID=S0EUW7_CHTCT|nr:NAD(P)-dependent oxidoreductase [Chthonomonas calidirosea]CCW35480.1 Nucleoside-diphosphate-sugar epimerases [Chthonomonas calidirosea T49]CEK19155.1 nucleoside-diphosphate-sugar epimerase [Chthonomonas calidirosea]CEK19162.1 nucleoside-diphosphate-sugar epimerase [Chthonomonas calidirosea]CEK20145.1 nucleoside-diphosphate-sugar epimerase [Chthonomonas calidirosea]
MRVLLTGATGFIGAHTLRKLLEEGQTVAILLRPTSDPWRIQDLLDRVTVLYGDLTHPQALASQLKPFQPEAIVHLAWQGVVNTQRNDVSQIFENIPTSLELIRLSAEAGCKHWIGLGSQAEYGPANRILSEDMPTSPTTLYGSSKLALRYLAEGLCNFYGMRFVWLRLFSAYGPMDSPHWLIPYLILTLLKGEHPKLTKGEQLWDYIFVSDVAEAICTVLREQQARGVFNLGSGEARPLRTIIETIRDNIDPSLNLGFGEVPYRPDQVMHLQADIGRLKAIGWEPKTPLEQGLKQTVEWYRANRNRYDS